MTERQGWCAVLVVIAATMLVACDSEKADWLEGCDLMDGQMVTQIAGRSDDVRAIGGHQPPPRGTGPSCSIES